MNSSTKELKQIIFQASTIQVKIPKYQRAYSWGTQQVEEFWDDIIQENPTFFIGPIIINIEHQNENDGFVEVVDGQQRLITSTILAAVLRDTYNEYGENDKAKNIQSHFIAYVDLDNVDKGYRLTPGLSTSTFFKEHLQSGNSEITNSNPTEKEHKRIKDNYQTFKQSLDLYLSPETTNEEKIKKIGKVRDRLNMLKVIVIEIENDREAYEIFERVNNYGIDLSLSDLLKNQILKNHSNPDSAHLVWYEIEKNIRSSDEEMKKFIRYHWLSKYGFKTEKRIYDSIKDEVTDYNQFLNELHESSELFNKILKGGRNDFIGLKINGKDISSKIYKIISASRDMAISQDNVFYMSLIRNIEKDKLNVNPSKLLIILENFLFKYFAISKLPANKVERMFSKYSVEIQNLCNSSLLEDGNKKIELTRLYDLFKNELIDLIPPKDFFIERFSQVKYSTAEKSRKLIRYVLKTTEYHFSENNETVIDFEQVNIEHFLPQKPISWNLSRADIKEYVNNIGNLTLIDKRINSQMGNLSLEEKIPKFLNSGFQLNTKLMDQVLAADNKWDKEQIEIRNHTLAVLAYDHIWK